LKQPIGKLCTDYYYARAGGGRGPRKVPTYPRDKVSIVFRGRMTLSALTRRERVNRQRRGRTWI